MTNEEIVLKRMEKKAKSPLHFGLQERYMYWNDYEYRNAKSNFNAAINLIKQAKTVKDKVYAIILAGYKARTYKNNSCQCKTGANRSAQDIYRIYKYYFPDENIDIFSIMRALYQLSIVDGKLGTYRCPTVRKQVFWIREYWGNLEYHNKADLGVPLKEWENIGL